MIPSSFGKNSSNDTELLWTEGLKVCHREWRQEIVLSPRKWRRKDFTCNTAKQGYKSLNHKPKKSWRRKREKEIVFSLLQKLKGWWGWILIFLWILWYLSFPVSDHRFSVFAYNVSSSSPSDPLMATKDYRGRILGVSPVRCFTEKQKDLMEHKRYAGLM